MSLAVAFALAEALARTIDPHVRDHVLPSGFFVIDPVLGWHQQPSHTVAHTSRDFEVAYTTNALGYRDRDRDLGGGDRANRILMFGDSQVFGWGVPEESRFSNLLETRHPGLEVWNLGVMAYGLDQQLLDYERIGRWQADAVGFIVSDVTLRRTTTGFYSRKPKPRFVLDQSRGLRLEPVSPAATTGTTLAYRLLGPWYLPYFVERRLDLVGRKLRRPPGPTDSAGPTPEESPSELTRLLLARAADTARARGHRVVILADLPQSDLETLRRMCTEPGIRLIALDFPPDRGAFIFSRGDPHWNQRAHDRVAGQFWAQWKRHADSDTAAVGDP